MRFLLAAGGTGGHIYPAIAIARQLMEQGSGRGFEIELDFAGDPDGLEGVVAPANGFRFHAIKSFRFPRRPGMDAVRFPFRFAASLGRAREIVRRTAPHAVIGTGGFVPVPVLLAASWMKKPVFIHEQNVDFGLGNRLLLGRARKAFVTFPNPRMERNRGIQALGNPIRTPPEMDKSEARVALGWDSELPKLLVFGGSQGARSINNAVLDLLEAGPGGLEPIDILHVTGRRDAAVVAERLAGIRPPEGWRYRTEEYMEDIMTAMRAADMTLCRAGASTLAEVCAIGTPAIIVPFPFSAQDHQVSNALAVQETGGAVLIRDGELDADSLRAALESHIRDGELLERMGQDIGVLGRPRAAEDIAEAILDELE